EAAMAYRRSVSPIVAGRSEADQRELALGVLRQQADGRWVWKLDPAYIQQRVQHGPPPRPALWPTLQRLQCPTLVVWGMESDVISEAQARPSIGKFRSTSSRAARSCGMTVCGSAPARTSRWSPGSRPSETKYAIGIAASRGVFTRASRTIPMTSQPGFPNSNRPPMAVRP